ncbi:MAG: hypothetical protein IPM47_00090 [Sphingobacteriales bacterium]|nr:MAG: hypothetical protein IPM47_00090 [Sphingobacteriales bacterium]
MEFGVEFDLILPNYLVNEEKARLRDALKQFTVDKKGKEIDYTDFYKTYGHAYFMQSDLVKEIRMSFWNEESSVFEKAYPDAIIISNTCDISFGNKHNINSKQCLFAPLIDFNEYIHDLTASGYEKDKLDQFIQSVKAQLVTNLFYLPLFHDDQKEFVVILDNLFWFPANELNSYIDNIQENRITSLSHFGYYLFILKLSYHLCRLPEQCDREVLI